MKWILMGLIIWFTLSIPLGIPVGRVLSECDDEG